MELIFHERQEGSLCAQHCLNALLQGSFFTAVDLASISQELDEQERERMAEGGLLTEEYRRFLAQPSSNMDDSGFFSVQVINKALEIWGLEMVPYGSTVSLAVEARAAPTQQNAFICNFREHWFSVRKLGTQWFNLNSINIGPELISETYLSLFLTQLQSEGYSIFIVIGPLPDCEADSVLKVAPAVQTSPTRSARPQSTRSKTPPTESSDMDLAMRAAIEASRNDIDDEDSSLQRAMAMSLRSAPEHSGFPANDSEMNEDESLKRALALSLQASSDNSNANNAAASSVGGSSSSTSVDTSSGSSVTSLSTAKSYRSAESSNPASAIPVQNSLSVEDMRLKRLAFLEKNHAPKPPSVNSAPPLPPSQPSTSSSPPPASKPSTEPVAQTGTEDEEDEELALALKMSKT